MHTLLKLYCFLNMLFCQANEMKVAFWIGTILFGGAFLVLIVAWWLSDRKWGQPK